MTHEVTLTFIADEQTPGLQTETWTTRIEAPTARKAKNWALMDCPILANGRIVEATVNGEEIPFQ